MSRVDPSATTSSLDSYHGEARGRLGCKTDHGFDSVPFPGGSPLRRARRRARQKQVGTFSQLVGVTFTVLGVALALFFMLAAAGCCLVDHERVAQREEIRRAAAERLSQLPDEELTPSRVRVFLARDADAHETSRATFGGAALTSATRARIDARKRAREARKGGGAK